MQDDPSSPDATPQPAAVAEDQPNAGRALLKLLLELGPLVLFFVIFKRYDDEREGLVESTKWFLGALVITLPLVWWMEKKAPVMAIVTAVFVGVFGGLTIWLDNDLFIKLKPTVASAAIALTLFGGLSRGKLFLKVLLGSTLQMTDEGWRQLTVRYSVFFLLIAVGNEIVHRNFSNDAWLKYKVMGILPLTFVFMMSQVGLMRRHELPGPKEAGPEKPSDSGTA